MRERQVSRPVLNGNESAPLGGTPPTFFCKSIIPGILILTILQEYHSKRLSADSILTVFSVNVQILREFLPLTMFALLARRSFFARVSFQGCYFCLRARVSFQNLYPPTRTVLRRQACVGSQR